MTAQGFTVSPTLLLSAFYRECHSHKIPQIHCAMIHTVLLYVVHAKLLSISTWKKAATLRARVTEYYKAIKSKKNLNRRLTENKMFWHRWIFGPQRARPIFYSCDLFCPCPYSIPSLFLHFASSILSHTALCVTFDLVETQGNFSKYVPVKLIMIRTLGSMLYNPCKLLTSGISYYFHIQWL